MNFNEAKRLLRDLGYSVTKAPNNKGVAEYQVHRIFENTETGGVDIKRWIFTADTIKAAVHRAISLTSN